MEWMIFSKVRSVFEPTVTTGEGSTMAGGHMNFAASYANDGVNAGPDRIARAKAVNKKPALAAQDRESTIRHGVCGVKLQCYRAWSGGRISCKRLQVQGSHPGRGLLLQIESNMRYYPACFPEDCLSCCGSIQHHIGRIQCGAHAGRTPRCDCPAAMDTLVSLRRTAA
jgi:hypothetical protein